jgi:hypothetical protein
LEPEAHQFPFPEPEPRQNEAAPQVCFIPFPEPEMRQNESAPQVCFIPFPEPEPRQNEADPQDCLIPFPESEPHQNEAAPQDCLIHFPEPESRQNEAAPQDCFIPITVQDMWNYMDSEEKSEKCYVSLRLSCGPNLTRNSGWTLVSGLRPSGLYRQVHASQARPSQASCQAGQSSHLLSHVCILR